MTGVTLTPNNNLSLESTVNVSGTVRIENGDNVFEYDNKITGVALAYFTSIFAGHVMTDRTFQNYRWSTVANNFVVLGTDTTHPTLWNTTALTSPIGTAPGTKPVAMNAATSQLGNDFFLTWLFTFPAGTMAGTVGEMAFYWNTNGGLCANNANLPVAGSSLNSRLSVADGEMAPWLIDSQKPIIITWTYKFTSDGRLLAPALMNLLNISTSSWDASNYSLMSYNWGAKSTWMVIGQDQVTPNNIGTTTGLTTPMNTGAGTGTKASSQVLTTSNPSNGVYKCTWSATWNAGTITAGSTLGEIGLFLVGWNYLQAYYFSGNTTTAYLHARLSSAQGHFTAQAIDSTKPLTVSWTITFTFA